MNLDVFRVRLTVVTQSAGSKNSGFTLIELMIVVIIIGILSAIAIPKFQDVASQAKAAACRSNLNALAHCMNFYAVDKGAYPSAGLSQHWRGFSLLEGYLKQANSYKCPLTGSTDYRYRLYGDDDTFAVRGWLVKCYADHGCITEGVASW